MKSLALTLVLAAGMVGCDAGKQAAASRSTCVDIASPVERLACFDAAAGTPASSPAAAPVSRPPERSQPQPAPPQKTKPPEIVEWVRRNEVSRPPNDHGFRLSRTEDALPGWSRVIISAPAQGNATAPPQLAISCLSNISRLQLLTDQPIGPNRMNVRLLLDSRPVAAATPWQVLEDGTVVDAGRGLVAIEQLRHLLRPAGLLTIESDYPPLSGLAFDAKELHTLMKQQREACHW